MGNWRSVNMKGTVEPEHLSALTHAVCIGQDYDRFHPLCDTGGLCGLGAWPSEEINAIGNLAERGYSVESVAACLRDLVKVAPSLELKVHCGGEYESDECVSTITVKDGEVTVHEPEIKERMKPTKEQIEGNLFKALLGARR